MIQFDTLVFNSFQVNTYLVYDETMECILIDPASYEEDEHHRLEKYIESKGLNPVLNINTHCHIDHILGIPFVRKKYGISTWAHEKEQKLLSNGPVMGQVFGFRVDPLPPLDKFLTHAESIRFGNSELKALHVPGHSEGSLAYYSETGGFVITGDALFAGSIGRTDLPGGNYDQLITSIRDHLLILPSETTIWPGHGPSSTIGEEVQNNPFLNDLKT